MLEAIFEFLGEMLLELVAQVVVQMLAELGWSSMGAPFQRNSHPGLVALGYGLFGAIAGGVSLLVVPATMLHGGWRLLGLGLSPLAGGTLMVATAGMRAAPGVSVLRRERFVYGYLFALTLGLIRFWFARH